MWYVVLLNIMTGAFGHSDVLSYTTEQRCLEKIDYVEEQFVDYDKNWQLKCYYKEIK